MSQEISELFVKALVIYGLMGIVYSFYFFSVKAKKMDPVFARAKWNVKFLMLPAALVLWPLIELFGQKND